MTGARVVSLNGETMGTTWTVRYAAEAPLDSVRSAIAAELDGIIAEMSNWEPASDINRFNRAAPGTWRSLPPRFFEVLEAALAVARDSDGAFDPALAHIVDRWGFGPSGRQAFAPRTEPPPPAQWKEIETDPAARRALQPGGVQLDFSGIAKGYAVDRVAGLLRARGIVHHLVEIGGELHGSGIRPDGQPWWTDVERPPGCALPPVRMALHNAAAATSGDYRRAFTHDGRTYSHAIDPATARPITNGVASVTVIHESAMMADALATALTVMGPERGAAFAAPRGLAAYFIVRTGAGFGEAFTPAFADMLG